MPTPTSEGYIFIEEGATLRTEDDLIAVASYDVEHCFASDDSGGLFTFSMRSGSYGEVDREKSSKIKALKIVEW